jgi:hypothetical protein
MTESLFKFLLKNGLLLLGILFKFIFMQRTIKLFAIFIFCIGACNKFKPKEPFSCKINGELFVPKDEHDTWAPQKGIGIALSQDNKSLSINATNFDNAKSFGIAIQLSYALYAKKYISNNLLEEKVNLSFDETAFGLDAYQTDSTHFCTIDITKIDTANNLIAGTFSGTLYSEVLGKECIVSDGQFSLPIK